MFHRCESSLLKPVASYLRDKSFCQQMSQLRFYEYSIDLYAFSENKALTVAVELKVDKWRRALEQALIYQLCSDWVFIAMPRTSISRVDGALLDKHGIGLIAVDETGDCEELRSSSLSSVLCSEYRDAYIQLLRGRHYAWSISKDNHSDG